MVTRIRSRCRDCKNYVKNQPERFVQVLADHKVKCTAAQDVNANMPCPKFEDNGKE
jgi:hypothetical protein